MSPELHLQMIDNRAIELRKEAADYRRARQAETARKSRSTGGHRRSLFGKIIPA
ncbi:hypothetical protein FHR32_003502 [Streptosporangium album]|uniref:Uncharacterized protein n=1 Tax=Streptosporangium album TaxID=47479 RepID=A0A7W7RW35_9ACTN|nr:hypothetical protein [Streptosporangium album]MBB4939197.1 hypothetical protein [Streptosporangium album]